jgi:phosphoglycerate kinase
MRTLNDLNVEGKKTFVRVDYNVPLEGGKIVSDARIQATLPTLRALVEKKARIILAAHLGRPKGKKAATYSLRPCAEHLSKILAQPVEFVEDCIGPEVKAKIDALEPGAILMLENLRFYPGEEKPDDHPEFVEKLRELADVYINDAFAVSHRKHASVYQVPILFKDQAAFGLLMEKEIQVLGQDLINEPKRPFYAVIGGSKVSTKLGVLKALLKKVDGLMLGGGLAYTFLKAKGAKVGKSLVENDFIEEAKAVLELAQERGVKIELPIDVLASKSYDGSAPAQSMDLEIGIPDDQEGVSIGPGTQAAWIKILSKVKTVFWNGPLGIYEVEAFAGPTEGFAKGVSELDAVKIAGGGDCVAAIGKAKLEKGFTYLSTGGGAALEFIEKGTLPGIEAIQ